MQALQVRRFKSRTTSAGLLLSTAIGLVLAQGAKTEAADYTNVVVPPNSTSVVNSGDTFTGTTGTALKLSRNVTLTLQNGPAPGPIIISGNGVNGHGIWAATDGTGTITGDTILFGPGVTTNITTNGNNSTGIFLGTGAGANVVFAAGSMTNIDAYLGMNLGPVDASLPALNNSVVLQDGSVLNVHGFKQGTALSFQGITMSGAASLHLASGSQLSVGVDAGGNFARGVLVSYNMNTGLGGVFTSDPGSQLSIVTRSDNQSDGLYTILSGRTVLRGATTIHTFGDDSNGALLVGNPDMERLIIEADANGPRSSIATEGRRSNGVYVAQGHARLGNTDINTSGADANGVLVEGSNSSVVTTNTTVRTEGVAGHGIVVSEGAMATATNTDVLAQGTGAAGLLLLGDTTTQTASFTGGTIVSSVGPAIQVAGGSGMFTLSDATVQGPNWLHVGNSTPFASVPGRSVNLDTHDDLGNPFTIGVVGSPALLPDAPGVANVTATNSNLTGAAITDAGSTSNVTLVNTIWHLTGNSNLTNLVNDPSLIDFSPPVGDPTLLSSYKTLTTANYVGEGGQIALNTYLGADASPSDRLVINGGTAKGTTGLIIRNTTGPGALTVADGILVVDTINGATSEPTAFTLVGNYVTPQGVQAVVEGAYAYTLNYGGVGANAANNNWYLRSEVEPAPPGPTPPPDPLYQAGVPLYEIYPQNLLALSGVPTMQQRVGNRYWQQPTPVDEIFCKDPAQNFKCRVTREQANYYADGSRAVVEGNGVWTRLDGSHYRIDPAETTSGSNADTDLWRLQAGFDGLLYEADGVGKLIGGVTVHYGQASSDVTSIFGRGSIETDGYGFGGTLTWLSQNGFYVDGQASLTWFNSDLSSHTAKRGLADGNDGFGYAFSMEAGKKIEVGGNWTITPQAQLVYANVNFDDFTDPFEARVSLDRGESLRGRLGVSADLDRVWKDEAGKTKRSHIYSIANLYYEFLDGSGVDVSGVKFENRPERLWGGLGVGGSYNWNDDKYSVFGEVSANTSLTGFADSYAFNGTAGFRVKW